MGLELARAYVNVRAQSNQLAGDFGAVKSKSATMLSGIAQNFSSVFSALGLTAGVAGFAALLRSGEDFNRKMRNSLAIMGDVSQALRVDMRNAAFEAAKATQFSASQAAESYYFLASAGLDAKQSIAAMPQVALFAQAGMFDMARATDLATDAQSALGLTVKDAGQNLMNLKRVTDVLVKANTLANASVEQFSLAITNKGGAAARMVSKDIEELTAVLAAYADQGLKAQEAGTAINIVMRDLQTKAIQNKKTFDEFGVAVYNSSGKMNKIVDIIADLERALSGLSDEQKKATLAQLGFSDKSMIFMQMLVGTSEKIRKYETELRKAGGTTKDVADKQMTPLQKGMAQIGATFTDIASTVMKLIGPMVESIGAGVSKTINAISVPMRVFTQVMQYLNERLGGFFTLIVKVIKYSANFVVAMTAFAGVIWGISAAYRAAAAAAAFFQAISGIGIGKLAIGTAVAIGAVAVMNKVLDEQTDALKANTDSWNEYGDTVAGVQDQIKISTSKPVPHRPLAKEELVDKQEADKIENLFDTLRTGSANAKGYIDITTEGLRKQKEEAKRAAMTVEEAYGFGKAKDINVDKYTEVGVKMHELIQTIKEQTIASSEAKTEFDAMVSSVEREFGPSVGLAITRDSINQLVDGIKRLELAEGHRIVTEKIRDLRKELKALEFSTDPVVQEIERMRVPGMLDSELNEVYNTMKKIEAVKGFDAANKSIEELRIRVNGLKAGLSDIEIDMKLFAKEAGVTPQQVEEKKALLQKKEFLTQAKNLIEELKTPQEKLDEQLKMLDKAYLEGLFGTVGSEEAIRKRNKAQVEAIVKAEPKTPASSQWNTRFGLANFGNKIQEAILKDKMVKVQEKALEQHKIANQKLAKIQNAVAAPRQGMFK